MTYERDHIRDMAGYVWGEQPDDPKVIKLNTNENPFPPSPRVNEVFRSMDASVLRRYPQPTADRLRDLLAAHHGVERDQIVVTNGGDEGLRLAFTTFVNAGDTFGMATPSYSLYPVLAHIQGAAIREVALNPSWRLPGGFARTLNEDHVRLTALANPHAPSGTLLNAETIARLAEALDGVLLIDEAYVDFADPELRHDVIRLIDEFDNLLCLRTFSKGYSLAGLRLGYLVGATSLIDPILNKTRDSYNVDAISQALGIAAFTDHDHAAAGWRRVRKQRARVTLELARMGFDVFDSQANFVLAQVASNIPLTAGEIHAALKARGVLVRYFDSPGMRHRLRITIGTAAENQVLLDRLNELLENV